ncbi:MAG: hypothetical protein ABWK00_03285 [Desulfurococcaceae archaeon]
MPGNVGTLVLAIHDPVWFEFVLERVKKRAVRYTLYREDMYIPPRSVIYSDCDDCLKGLRGSDDVVVVLDREHSCVNFERAFALLALGRKEGYRRLLVGVDMGKKLAYVILGDDILLDYGYIDEGSIHVIWRELSCYPAREVVIRASDLRILRKFLEGIKSLSARPVLEIVDEGGSSRMGPSISPASPRGAFEKDKNLRAALEIAYRKGVSISGLNEARRRGGH